MAVPVTPRINIIIAAPEPLPLPKRKVQNGSLLFNAINIVTFLRYDKGRKYSIKG
ncbi:hypothetical protein SAMN04487928_12724 [Butyrivibrio proteoclasticus]|uniref:Uncharacterized protein n=1 Tax=Butyrivibrio proteoclasticus TaxID=43305 RepID=A0A1I5X0V8_9FIRM|nr:hypothetical protein SAMN04487928_12724 [Butyrivibrio proteoclasticus]